MSVMSILLENNVWAIPPVSIIKIFFMIKLGRVRVVINWAKNSSCS